MTHVGAKKQHFVLPLLHFLTLLPNDIIASQTIYIFVLKPKMQYYDKQMHYKCFSFAIKHLPRAKKLNVQHQYACCHIYHSVIWSFGVMYKCTLNVSVLYPNAIIHIRTKEYQVQYSTLTCWLPYLLKCSGAFRCNTQSHALVFVVNALVLHPIMK